MPARIASRQNRFPSPHEGFAFILSFVGERETTLFEFFENDDHRHHIL